MAYQRTACEMWANTVPFIKLQFISFALQHLISNITLMQYLILLLSLLSLMKIFIVN